VSIPAVADPTLAASVVLARGTDSSELYLVQRADNLRFFGGFVAFPGGKVSPQDYQLAGQFPGLTALQVAAIRELFEETGVLLAGPGTLLPPATILTECRRLLLADQLSFPDFLGNVGITLQAEGLQLLGRLVTPPFAAMRFDTQFFLAVLPTGQQPEVWPGELAQGWWSRPVDAMRDWNDGKLLLSPPTVSLLEPFGPSSLIAEMPQLVQERFAQAAGQEIPPIWVSPGILMIPLEANGLPPATHTNAYRIGNGTYYLLDPGAVSRSEQDRLLQFLASQHRPGDHFAGVILTHHHRDHVGAAVRVAQEWGVPILAHSKTKELLRGIVPVDRELQDGETLDIGQAPHHSPGHKTPWQMTVRLTPGHAPGHLVFWDPTYRVLLVGDMISMLSSVVILHPEGNLAHYLDSLRLLLGYPARLLLPAHGSPTARCQHVLEETIRHREIRENQLLEMLSATPRSLPDLTLELYRGLPSNLMQLAELQMLAGLHKLRHQGQVEMTPEQGWIRLS
jgi:glyoxylase-like metal-dependent hydrolase (beta-lactamase superfamily II)/8-oxo-dGTP pyrophosphatase MutT (NUDIX family)